MSWKRMDIVANSEREKQDDETGTIFSRNRRKDKIVPAMNSLPRICLLTHGFYPVVGGTETHTRLLSERLIKKGVKLFVVTRRKTYDLSKHEVVGNIPVYRVPPSGFERFGKYFMFLPALIYLIRRRTDYDILYVCGFKVLGVPAVLAAKLLRKKCILRAEVCGELSGGYAYTGSKLLAESKAAARLFKGYIAIRNFVLRRADLFVSISNQITKEFKENGISSGSIAYLPNGIDTEIFKPVSHHQKLLLRKKLSLPYQDTIVTYTGRLSKEKGVELLLPVWKRVVLEYPHAYLLLVGSGGGQAFSCETKLRDYVVKNDLSDRVGFTGYVENVHEYLQASDIFVLPSESEGLPVALIEALACKLPSVATKVGGILDIIIDGMSGLLVEPKDPEGLYNAIRWLFNNRAAAVSFGERGRATVQERFSIDVLVDSHLTLFCTCCFIAA
jgi:glycosyltransferase involved in cell wall biosynthesis